MNVLALETSSNACSVGIMADTKRITKREFLPAQHGNVTLPWIEELLSATQIKLADLTMIAYSCGPGSFTGIRVGAAIAQAIALAHALPIAAIPSLRVLAQGIYRKYGYRQVLVLLDARMGQVYAGSYVLGNDGLMFATQSDALVAKTALADIALKGEQKWCLVTDCENYQSSLGLVSFEDVVMHTYPDADDVLTLGVDYAKHALLLPPEQALPIYLRSEEYWQKID
jgi:tRNA threonylcarbamoyladenosine biosynthesis protein TsaB